MKGACPPPTSSRRGGIGLGDGVLAKQKGDERVMVGHRPRLQTHGFAQGGEACDRSPRATSRSPSKRMRIGDLRRACDDLRTALFRCVQITPLIAAVRANQSAPVLVGVRP